MSPMAKLFTCWSDACIHANYDTYGDLFLKSMILAAIFVPFVIGGICLWAWIDSRKTAPTAPGEHP